MPRRPFRIALVIVVASFLAGGGAVAWVVNQALHYPERHHKGTGQDVTVEIEPGMSFPAVATRLAAQGVIDKPRWFRLYAMYRGVTTMVRSGRYVLADDMTPHEVLDRLLAGVKGVTVAVTIPEGLNMNEVFAIIGDSGVVTAAELAALARDRDFLAKHGIEGDTVEGYLFPETYRFAVPTRADAVLDTMIKQHRITWDRIRREHGREIERLQQRMGWTDRQFLILASIVEKEAVVAEERPRIAQVFINRLTSSTFKPRYLATDPTIRYGCTVLLDKSPACRAWDVTDRLHRAQLDDDANPYNTYRHEGLPPGPISNPGEASLLAAVTPDGSGFFYFVAKDDRTHAFSRTLEEHQRNVDRYQR